MHACKSNWIFGNSDACEIPKNQKTKQTIVSLKQSNSKMIPYNHNIIQNFQQHHAIAPFCNKERHVLVLQYSLVTQQLDNSPIISQTK